MQLKAPSLSIWDKQVLNYLNRQIVAKKMGLIFWVSMMQFAKKIWVFAENGENLVFPGIHLYIFFIQIIRLICGFLPRRQLGVDLEKIKPIDFEDIQGNVFSEEWVCSARE